MKPKDAAAFALIMADRFFIQELAVGLNSSQAPALKLKMMILFFYFTKKRSCILPVDDDLRSKNALFQKVMVLNLVKFLHFLNHKSNVACTEAYFFFFFFFFGDG